MSQRNPAPGDRRSPLHAFFCSAAVVLSLACAPPAVADAPDGVISCTVWSAPTATNRHRVGFAFQPFLTDDAGVIHARVTNAGAECDNSSVIGGKAPITDVLFKLDGSLPDATCSSFQSTSSSMERGKLRLRWKGSRPSGRRATVATSRAAVDGFSFDEETATLTITTTPIEKGAFAGRVATLTLVFDSNLTYHQSGCGSSRLGFLPFGYSSPSTFVVE